MSTSAFAVPATSETDQADILGFSHVPNGSKLKPSVKHAPSANRSQAVKHGDWIRKGWEYLGRNNIEAALTTWQQGVNRLPPKQLLAFTGVYAQRSTASKQLKRLGLVEKAIIVRADLHGKQVFYVLSARRVPSDKSLRRTKLASLYKALHTSETIFANAAEKFQTVSTVAAEATVAAVATGESSNIPVSKTREALKSVKQTEANNPDVFSVSSIEISGNTLMTSENIKQRVTALIGKNKTKIDVFNALQTIVSMYEKNGYDGVSVAVSEDILGGVVAFHIGEDDIKTENTSSTDAAVRMSASSNWIEQGWQRLDAKDTSAALVIWQQGVNELPKKQLLAFLGVYIHLNEAIIQAQRAGLTEKAIILQSKFKDKSAYYVMSARHIPADKSMRSEKLASLYQAINATDIIYANEAKRFHTKAAPIRPETGIVTTKPKAGTFTITAFNFIGNSLIADETLRKELKVYTGKNKTRDDLIAAKQAILQLYRGEGFETIAVGLPRKISSENISIRIVEVRIGQVSTPGVSKTSGKSIKAAMSALQSGEVVNADVLNKQLREISQQKNIKSAQLVYHPTDQGVIDVEILVDKESPMKWGLMASSLGTQETGRALFTGIFYHNNVLDAGHELTLSYTTSEKTSKLRLYSALYKIPVETFDGKLILSFSRADISSGQVLGVLDSRGNGTLKSIHYEQTFFRTYASRHYLDFGYEQHRFLERFNSPALPLAFSIGITTRPVVLGYGYEGSTNYGEFGLRASYHHNAPFGTQSNNASYRLLNPASFANWSFYKLSADYEYNWDNRWSLSGKAGAQLSNNALISGERSYITGLSKVRGFEEVEAFGDSAFFLRTQLTTPDWLPDTRFHAFVDAGRYELNFPFPGELASANIASTGVGVHWTPAFGLDLLAEVGVVLKGLPVAPNGSATGHFKVIYWLQ